MATPRARAKQTQTTPENTQTTRPKTRRPAVQQPVYEPEIEHYPERPRRGISRYIAVGCGALALGAAAFGVYAFNQQKIEAENGKYEGLLRYGFDIESIAIDVSGNTDRLAVTCPDATPITYMFDKENTAAYLEVPALMDASGNVELEPGSRRVYPLEDIEQISTFVTESFLPACETANSGS